MKRKWMSLKYIQHNSVESGDLDYLLGNKNKMNREII